jgi:hypothetical protein
MGIQAVVPNDIVPAVTKPWSWYKVRVPACPELALCKQLL